jgi:hypothetical protein
LHDSPAEGTVLPGLRRPVGRGRRPHRGCGDGRARWYARYRTPDDQQRTKTFARKIEAERFLVEVESSKQRGSFVDAPPASLTVGDWADDWLAAQADSASSPGS